MKFVLPLGCLLSLTLSASVLAQGGNAPPDPAMNQGDLALKGYCPVCVGEMKKWQKGDAAVSLNHDGKVYRFKSAKERQMFAANPQKYAAGNNGNCPVCFTDMQMQVPGSPQFAAMHRGKLYVFAKAEAKEKFVANPSKYADPPLALDGNCPVCKVDMGKDMAGKSELVTDYDGRRYQFAMPMAKEKFLADPSKYAVSDVALDGNCPVCRVEMKKSMPGIPEISTVYDGVKYQFAGRDQQTMFLADPSKYSASAR